MHKGHAESGARSQAKSSPLPIGAKAVLDESGLAALLAILVKVGYTPIGPRVRDGAVVYDEISSLQDLPVGLSDDQDGGRYRLVPGTPGAFFEYVVGPVSWKKYLFPPRQKLLEANRGDKGFGVEAPEHDEPCYAFFGVRPCELAAIRIQDRVFGYEQNACAPTTPYVDSGYAARRAKALIIAVNCGRAGKTCFCCSMGGAPEVEKGQGYDLVLTELLDGQKHEFVVEVGSERGALVLELLPQRSVTDSDTRMAEAVVARARRQMGRTMIPDVNNVLKKNLEHPRWDAVAERCLTCGNCTMACPTCFCNTVEDVTDLKGDHAERWRLWDSCFSIDFSYIHGGSVRREVKSRYRQWMTHKLSNWHDQFGTSGCVGCGRCITWCPVGIDITEEAKAIKYSSR